MSLPPGNAFDVSPPGGRRQRPGRAGSAAAAWWRALFVAAMSLLWLGAAHAGVLVITTGPAQPGRFVAMEAAAREHGLALHARFVEKIPADELNASLWQGASLVLLDAPRAHIEQFMRAKLGAALPALEHVPHVWLPTAAPKPGGGVDAEFAARVHGYFVQGGARNTEWLLAALAAQRQGGDWRSLPAPLVFPRSAIYHPALPQTVLPTPAAYLAWKGVRADAPPAARAPVIGIAFHQQSIASGQTAPLDDLVARIEAGGAIALPFYAPVLEADAVRRMTTLDGRPVIDALVNMQITLGAEQRRAEFDALGVPVIQAMSYRRGDAAAWAADAQGVQLNDVPFYLAQAEYAGIADIQVTSATRAGDEQLEPIAPQAAAVAGKALRLVVLQRKPEADKRVAIFFWNYPPGEKNLSASFMNLPRSLVGTLAALKAAGYATELQDETPLTLLLQRLLAPGYRPADDREVLEALLRDGLAERLSVARYRAWLQTLPEPVRASLLQRWGDPERSSWVLRRGGEAFFVVPRLQLGHVTLLPQPGRGERSEDKERSLYHSTSAVPPHHYLATYLWAREQFHADALVHFGTHGTQEWLPGKERGLSVFDWPMLAVGDVPVAYPYIVDNIGEALQAKRRGRAVIVSHQTPPFAPAGLHDALTRIHDLLHQWKAQEPGAVKDKLRAAFIADVRRERIERDMGWSAARIERDFPAFLDEVHDHLHEIARAAQPMGLHTFGRGADERWRVATVLTMLGKPFWEAVAAPGEQADEMLVGDWTKLVESTPYRRLRALLDGSADLAALPEPARAEADKARAWYEALGAAGETRGLLTVLDGRYLPTSYGGDPIKNPDALPTGRNLYGFDPSRVPTKAAWEAGREAFEQLLAAHRAQSGGKTPKKVAFTLWSVETMRHFGLLEAQALWAMGVEPVWDAGGRVTDVKLVPREQLGRPRVDVVLSATGLYRDHFPNVMRQLAKAVTLAAGAHDEPDNAVAANSARIAATLRAQGLDEAAATRAAQTRIFSSESGRYGTGLDDAALATDTWKTQGEGDRKLAALYLSRMQFAYGPDESEWGRAGAKGNLYAEQLKGTEAAVLARSSNLYGMLTTDDPFQYLGGLGLAVRQLDGKAPELYISNLRGSGANGGAGRVEGAAKFLATELATRNFHPGYIRGLMDEGYAGALQVLDGINNFAGWQSVAREVVRDDQWQEFMDVYVRDKHRLGLKQWFESRNPHALAQSIERMLEAARLGQWKADAKSVAELKARYNDLARRYDVKTDNRAFERFVAAGSAGFGLQTPSAAAPPTPAAAEAPPSPTPPPPPPIRGLRLERQAEAAMPPPVVVSLAGLLAFAALLLAVAGGAWRARRDDAPPALRAA